MTRPDPNLAKVELIAAVLGPLCEQVIFVGGCTVGLLITDPAAAPVRVTYDVDLVASVQALRAYHEMEKEFTKLGFKRDVSSDAPICRWRYRGLEVDLMPTDPGILGFSNRWYPLAAASADRFRLPSGAVIRLITAPVFIATKFEAYKDRGASDPLASHDLEDIINVIDGRPTLLEEISVSGTELRDYLREQCRALLATTHFLDYLPGIVDPSDVSSARADAVADRLRSIAGS